jgi:hypothetical protein
MTWQPIETAPRGGQQFLAIRRLMEAPWHSMSVAAWLPTEGQFLANLAFWDPEDFQEIWTHWHDLPAPPDVTR